MDAEFCAKLCFITILETRYNLSAYTFDFNSIVPSEPRYCQI